MRNRLPTLAVHWGVVCSCAQLALAESESPQQLPAETVSSPNASTKTDADDPVHALQTAAMEANEADWGYWGWLPKVYTHWGTHSNRLVPVYTFGSRGMAGGASLADYKGTHSVYRDEAAIEEIFGYVPDQTVNLAADYLDQTNIFDLQWSAMQQGKKHVVLIVFDGMDWQTTWAAATYATQNVSYRQGRGTGLHFQDYKADGTTEYGWMVTSPSTAGAKVDVDAQTAAPKEGAQLGGYSIGAGGPFPWSIPNDSVYPVGRATDEGEVAHAYTDSASSASSMTAGRKTYNGAINVGPNGELFRPLGQLAQSAGYRVGAVSSVPISHATPAAAYAHNVSRNDYQDLTRDLLGLNSVSHPEEPLSGLDVLIGCGAGESRPLDVGQGVNFVPGNPYLTEQDRQMIDVRNGGPYVVATRQQGVAGAAVLEAASEDAIAGNHRLFGFFGVNGGHLPFQTADGSFNPAVGRRMKKETYSEADVLENPTLAQATEAALSVLSRGASPFWLLVEAGDVDWANHDNNIDNSIGAVLSGDAAVKAVTDWVETNSNWDESLVIVTADHGHYLVLADPEVLIE